MMINNLSYLHLWKIIIHNGKNNHGINHGRSPPWNCFVLPFRHALWMRSSPPPRPPIHIYPPNHFQKIDMTTRNSGGFNGYSPNCSGRDDAMTILNQNTFRKIIIPKHNTIWEKWSLIASDDTSQAK